MEAVKKGNLEEVRKLLDAKADVNVREQESGITPLISAILYSSQPIAQWVQIVTLLCRHGANRYLTDKKGKTAFDYGLEDSGRNNLVVAMLNLNENFYERAYIDASAVDAGSMPPAKRKLASKAIGSQSAVSGFPQLFSQPKKKTINPESDFIPFDIDGVGPSSLSQPLLQEADKEGYESKQQSKKSLDAPVDKTKTGKTSAMFKPLELDNSLDDRFTKDQAGDYCGCVIG